jgi:very-short-patch-repair endonuclease
VPGACYRILRFWNNEIMKDIEAVLQAIDLALEGKM